MQRRIFKTLLLAICLLMGSLTTYAKSLVIELTNGLSVYYKLGGEVNPQLVFSSDGTFTLNTQTFSFADVQCFRISATDFSGENNTLDAIAIVNEDGAELTEASLYDLNGKRLGKASELLRQQSGTYIIRNAEKSIKVIKR